MAGRVAGTFAATGTSDSVTGRIIAVHAEFAGTATVSVEWWMNGTWREITAEGADKTGTFSYIYEGPQVDLRLNCSAHTDDVVYELRAD